jgi:signal transduction histidine kinase
MKRLRWQTLQKLRALLEETSPPAEQVAAKLRAMEREVILPVKVVFILILIYNLYFSSWFEDIALPQTVAQQTIERFFLIYLLLNGAVGSVLVFGRRVTAAVVQRLIFTSNFVDGLFLAALTFVTGGFESILYWLFLGLIVRNAVSCPLAAPQILLNVSASFCYLAAGLLDVSMADSSYALDELTGGTASSGATEPFLLRLFVLWLLTACCYGLQVLLEKQRRAAEDSQEFVMRQEQLRAAGRLAAKIAHQIKNPLGIINNAAYSLQRSLQEGKTPNAQQIQIIREEVERADHTITKLMGYAQLAEGKVERLKVAEEIQRAIDHAMPPAAKYPVTVEKDVAAGLPLLFMQRGHLSEILVNLIQNARESIVGKGHIRIKARTNPNESVVVTLSDDGPGIAKMKLDKVFQPYFTTKQKGTGLGLPIVKHNIELYGGTVQVESELGKGTQFTLVFPTRTTSKSTP